jgi:hypothetical protein
VRVARTEACAAARIHRENDENTVTVIRNSLSRKTAKMIIPTPEHDPMFAEDGVPFRTKMIQYIQREFSDLLGPHMRLLETESGLDSLSAWHAQAARIERQPPRRAA